NELEEERRLCFVGITRAQQYLILTRANYRTMRGLRERAVPSPFIGEMPKEALEIIDRGGATFNDDRDGYRHRFSEQSERFHSQFRRGQMVRHPTFGVGQIADLSNSGAQTRAVIDFKKAGRKTLILEYARLEVVG